jgi:hypothetical protein
VGCTHIHTCTHVPQQWGPHCWLYPVLLHNCSLEHHYLWLSHGHASNHQAQPGGFQQDKGLQLQLHSEALDKLQAPFATEDIDAIQEGSLWITSPESSHHQSVSPFTYSMTHMHTSQSVGGSMEQTTPPRFSC